MLRTRINTAYIQGLILDCQNQLLVLQEVEIRHVLVLQYYCIRSSAISNYLKFTYLMNAPTDKHDSIFSLCNKDGIIFSK